MNSKHPPINRAFHDVLTAAVRDMQERGFDDPTRLQDWLRKLRFAAISHLPPYSSTANQMQAALESAFKRAIAPATVLRHHPGVPRFTVERITPSLRTELDRRILASTGLIKLNRDQMIERTLQRFSGWATSIPAGGSRAVEMREVKLHIAKPLQSLPYIERRVMIDQGHKLVSSVNAVIAEQTGAIAMIWRSHWRRPGYDYREDHKERDKRIYAIRGSWAIERGLINKGTGYTDQMTAPCEEVNCTCYGVYLNNLRDLPLEMLTAKGKKLLEETRLGKK